MKIEDIIALTKAGFTKDEILTLTSTPKSEPEPVKEEPEPAKEEPKAEPPKEEPKTTEKEDLTKYIHDVVESTFKPFEDLYTNMSKLAGMPSIDNVQPKSIDDIVSKFLADN